MRVCKQCGVEKPLDVFHKSASCVGGYRVVCKACVALQQKEYRAANAEKVAAIKRASRIKNLDKHKHRDAEYYEQNKARCNANSKAWYERNKEKAVAHATEWAKANPEKVKAAKRKNKSTRKETVKAEYQRNKADYFARAAGRRVSVKQATPSWADKEQVAEMYIIAGKLNGFFTKPMFHVDHIVPLNNPLVCGLHTHTNLEILPAKRNLSKGNRHWPDMP